MIIWLNGILYGNGKSFFVMDQRKKKIEILRKVVTFN